MKGVVYGDLKTYRGWKSVPGSLKTRTALKRDGKYVPHGVKAEAFEAEEANNTERVKALKDVLEFLY